MCGRAPGRRRPALRDGEPLASTEKTLPQGGENFPCMRGGL